MTGIFKNIGIILITSLLIVATGGLPVYRHICHCEGEMTASVFLEADCDHSNSHGAASCCSASDAHSCCGDVPRKEKMPACHDGNCCENSSLFIRVSDSFQAGSVLVPVKPVPVTSAILIVYLEEEAQSCIIDKSYNSDLPPPEPGKKIVLAHHQLKLDPSQV